MVPKLVKFILRGIRIPSSHPLMVSSPYLVCQGSSVCFISDQNSIIFINTELCRSPLPKIQMMVQLQDINNSVHILAKQQQWVGLTKTKNRTVYQINNLQVPQLVKRIGTEIQHFCYSVFQLFIFLNFSIGFPGNILEINQSGMKQGCKRRNINIDDIIIKLTETPYNERSFTLRDYEVEGLCVMIKTIMIEQPMLLELEAPIQVCGDTHGQFNDLLTIFKLFGAPEKSNYLFLGDYVDRGKQSLECICLLMAYKIKYPNNFFLLRGNHESSQLNKLYGFYDECKRRMNMKTWKIIADTFNFFPIAAVVSNRIFCVHGGLSPLVKSISSLNTIKRPIEPTGSKVVSDMLWSDPKPSTDGWSDNFQRGTSYYYGKNVIDLFLNKNQFDLICRSHQVVQDGYEFGYEKKLITIFSAPNYCGQFTNLGAVLKISAQLMCRIQQFEGQPLFIKKRNRSVTPIRKLVLQKNEKQNLLKVEKPNQEVKARKATRIFKALLEKIDQSSLNLDDDDYQPQGEESSKTQ